MTVIVIVISCHEFLCRAEAGCSVSSYRGSVQRSQVYTFLHSTLSYMNSLSACQILDGSILYKSDAKFNSLIGYGRGHPICLSGKYRTIVVFLYTAALP